MTYSNMVISLSPRQLLSTDSPLSLSPLSFSLLSRLSLTFLWEPRSCKMLVSRSLKLVHGNARICSPVIIRTEQMASSGDARKLWKQADAITFDVDSTVIQEEGIDELAKFCGKGEQVAALTRQAMQGNVTFQESLATRLNIIRPSLQQIKDFISTHPPKLTPGIRTLIETLREHKKQVFLISGGFHCLIDPVAAQLDIPSENVYANRLKFYFTGEYAGFDENEPTSRSGGKAKVIQLLKDERKLKCVVHVGDGATDLETMPPADSFIGYGGNVVRDSVKSRAPWFVTDFSELTTNL